MKGVCLSSACLIPHSNPYSICINKDEIRGIVIGRTNLMAVCVDYCIRRRDYCNPAASIDHPYIFRIRTTEPSNWYHDMCTCIIEDSHLVQSPASNCLPTRKNPDVSFLPSILTNLAFSPFSIHVARYSHQVGRY
jgi:hypothetical protein